MTRARLALPPVLQQAGVALDRPRHQVTRDGTFLALSKKEFAVLEIMMRAQSVVVSTEELLERRATSTPTRSPIPCA